MPVVLRVSAVHVNEPQVVTLAVDKESIIIIKEHRKYLFSVMQRCDLRYCRRIRTVGTYGIVIIDDLLAFAGVCGKGIIPVFPVECLKMLYLQLGIIMEISLGTVDCREPGIRLEAAAAISDGVALQNYLPAAVLQLRIPAQDFQIIPIFHIQVAISCGRIDLLRKTSDMPIQALQCLILIYIYSLNRYVYHDGLCWILLQESLTVAEDIIQTQEVPVGFLSEERAAYFVLAMEYPEIGTVISPVWWISFFGIVGVDSEIQRTYAILQLLVHIPYLCLRQCREVICRRQRQSCSYQKPEAKAERCSDQKACSACNKRHISGADVTLHIFRTGIMCARHIYLVEIALSGYSRHPVSAAEFIPVWIHLAVPFDERIRIHCDFLIL